MRRPKAYSLVLPLTVLVALAFPGTAAAAPMITSGPSGNTSDNTPTFTFQEFLIGTFRCSIDDPSPNENCNSGTYTSAPLAVGPHTFYVEGFGVLGSTGVTPQFFTVVDTTPPAAPTITDTDPNSPANDNNPEVKGTAEAGSTVRLYKTSDCSGTAAGSGNAAAFSSPGISVNVADNSSTQIRATATDAAGNVSSCSAAITYVEDSTGPAAPTGLTTSPASPSTDNDPEVKGSASSDTVTVEVFKTSNCTGPSVSGTKAQFEGAGITVSVSSNQTTQLSARAIDAVGNPSACSTSINYVEDSTGPPAPTGLTTSPASPANDNDPEVKGSASSDTVTVEIFKNADCSGAAAASGTKAQFEGAGITVSVSSNQSTALSARAIDGLGNTSACSTPINYVEDSAGPAAPTGLTTSPASPSTDNDPEVKGSASSDTVTVEVFKTNNCTGPSVSGTKAQFEGPGITVSVTSNQTTPLSARAIDGLGNTSSCSASINYVEDSAGPAAPTGLTTSPASPSSDNDPEVKGSASGDTVTVEVFKTNNCTGPSVSGTKAQFEGPGITVSVTSNQTTPLSARAIDGLGNTSSCSASINYVEDSAGPAAPTGLTTSPASPANDNNPEVKGTAEAGSDVRVYKTANCTGPAAGPVDAAVFATTGVSINVPNDSTTQISATATDDLGNTSGCSTSITYVEDSGGPDTPSGLSTSPASPANDNDPEVKGTAEAGTTVEVFTNANCSGTAANSGSAAQFSGAGISISVAGNSTTQVSARALDGLNNPSGCSSPITYVEDSNAPSAPSGLSTDPTSPGEDETPRVKGTAEAGSTARVYKTANCTGASVNDTAAGFASPGIEISVADGSATQISADARDAAGNVSPCSAPITYQDAADPPVDSAAPDTTITGAPAGLIANRTPSFTFASPEAGVTYRCRLDSDAFAGCSSPFTAPSLKDGTHTFGVAAVDAAGNQDASPAEASFKVDGTAPTTRITKVPKKPGGKSKRAKAAKGASFQFSADESEVTFECRIDKAGFAPCRSPHAIAGIPNGKHVFRVRATDLVGNLGPAVKAKFFFRKKKGGSSGPPIPDPPSVDPCAVQPTITGTAQPEVLTGTAGSDVIHGLDGDDRVDGGGGDDLICGGGGNDDLNGGPGDDLIKGISGDDQLAGGIGSDSLLADEGNDRLEGMSGNDLLYGASGSDFLVGGSGADFLDGGLGNDRCDGGSDKDSGVGCERATPF